MRGHIRERSRGHWAIILDSRDPQTGKRRRRWHSHVGTKRSAQIECARLIAVALSAMNIDQLRAHRLKQAEELLAIGIRQTEDTFVYIREDGEPMQPRSLIPSPIDQNRCAHWRNPMDMIRQG
jgi:hypothetical protein